MKKTAIFLVILTLCAKQCLASTIDAQGIRFITDDIEKASADVVGSAVAIIQNDRVIYKKTFGYKEVNGAPVDDNTLFGLASVSKAVVATSLATLAVKNIISFEDKVKVNNVNLSLKTILSHTTGYHVRGDREIENGIQSKALLTLLKKEKRSYSQAKHHYFYSNLVYSLTQDYAQTKGYKIDDLLKILNCSFYTLPIYSKNLAYPHSRHGKKIAFLSNYQKTVPAAAGVFSSLNGMIEFVHIILGNRPHIISQTGLNQLFHPIAKANDVFNWHILPFKDNEVTSWYGLGWRRLTLKSNSKATLIFHSGFINGATAFVGIIPELQVGIVVLANQSSGFSVKTGFNIWQKLIS